MPKSLTNINVPVSGVGVNALTTPATQLYPYAANAPHSPGQKLRGLVNSGTGQQQMQTIEYGPGLAANGANFAGLQTLFSAPIGTAGVVEKIRITGAGNGMVNDWIQISYDGGNTFPFVAELGTLFGFYPGTEINGVYPIMTNCAHMAAQQANEPNTAIAASGVGYGTNGTFFATGILKYPIPFTNGLLIQGFNPTAFSYGGLYTEATVNYCSVSQVPPYQLRSTGSSSAIVVIDVIAMTFVGSLITATVASTAPLVAGSWVQFNGTSGNFATNGPTGTQTVVSVLSGTQFTFTNTNGTPTGSYTPNTWTIYNWNTTNTTAQGLTINNANCPMNGYIFGNPPSLTATQSAQLASITGQGWAVGLAYTAQTQTVSPTDDLSYLERNFGWYIDGATAPVVSSTAVTTTPNPTNSPNITVSACTFASTTITATVSSTLALGVGLWVTVSGITGFTTNNPNGTVQITSVNQTTNVIQYIASLAPTGTYSSGGTVVTTTGGSQQLVITGLTNSGTTCTATVAALAGIGTGQLVQISNVSGFTTNNPNGWYQVSAVPTSSTFSYVVANAPTGSYTANSGMVLTSGSPYGTGVGNPTIETTGTEDTFDSCYYAFATAFAFSEGGAFSTPVFPTSGSAITNYMGSAVDAYIQTPAGVTISGVVMGTPGESVNTALPYSLSPGQSDMIRLAPGGTTTFTYTGPSYVITAMTNASTTVTATVASNSQLQVGQTVIVTGATGLTNVNGSWVIASLVSTNQFTFVTTSTPSGSYGASSASVQSAPAWAWIVSAFPWGGPVFSYSQPTSMGSANGTPSRNGYYNAFLDILESCGGYRYNTSLQLWLLKESHNDSTGTANISSTLLYYADLT